MPSPVVACLPVSLWFAKIQDGYEIGYFKSVDDFVTAKAPNFNKIQQGSTSEPQTIQQESLRNNKIPQTSTSLVTWFGTRRPEVQILSPRPFFPIAYLGRLVFSSHDSRRF
jgi:hypothetical protein